MDQETIQEQEEEIATLKSIYEKEITELEPENSLKRLQVNLPFNLDSALSFKAVFYFNKEQTSSEETKGEAPVSGGASAPDFVISEHKFSSLPSVLIDLLLPSDYPSHSPPSYKIKCDWMDDLHYEQIFNELDALWYPGVGILFSWLDWLSNSLLSTLTADKNEIELNSLKYSFPSLDKRILREMKSIDRVVPMLIQNDKDCEEARFLELEMLCEVCYDTKKGSEFYRMYDCPHLYCKECLNGYCQMHVKDGTVQNLKCPTKSCDVLIHPSIVADAVGTEEFERWERLLLERTIDTMEDMQYCPRCQYPAECDYKNRQAICASCYFVFCSDCNSPWHLGNCLDGEQVVQVELAKLKKSKITKEEYLSKSHALQELKRSEKFLKSTSQPCPKCRVQIHKFEGCNKVTCNQCGTSFCYLCGGLGGYEHFTSGKCQLFYVPNGNEVFQRYGYDRVVPERFNQMQNAIDRQAGRASMMNCTSCGQRSAKIGNNNHVRCWSCNAHLCYHCKSRIIGPVGKHFSGLVCPQHS
ncbi:hypothetical protein LOD99_316 [Oopsacas minuta]|uniref:RBR-type E3 ubiquitin transferase n=1 Tax=Oopsacas minuta TaxID=111878 RepID=A0AAV7K8W2_9METZ|nr:hypothetical protein LOD99_316 [Oopsacas minuta]